MPVERRVLLVAGTVTSTARLLAVLPLIESDRRVHVVFTHDEHSPSTLMAGVPELLENAQVKLIPWRDATKLTWDLILTASEKDRVHQLDGLVILLPHGAGFQKRDVAHGGVAGLGSVFLLGEDTQPKPAAIALSHPEQRDLLASSCPEAVDRAVVRWRPLCGGHARQPAPSCPLPRCSWRRRPQADRAEFDMGQRVPTGADT